MTIVDAKIGSKITTSNDPESAFYKLMGNGFVEVIADVTNNTKSDENILSYIKCNIMLADGIEGVGCETLCENSNMTGFVSGGMGSSMVGAGVAIFILIKIIFSEISFSRFILA